MPFLRLRHGRKTRYGWVANPYPTGTFTLQDATSFARRSGYQPDYSALTMDAQVIFPWDRKVFDGDELVVNPRYVDIIDE